MRAKVRIRINGKDFEAEVDGRFHIMIDDATTVSANETS